MPTKNQDALARTGDRLGQLLSTAGDCWDRGDDVPPWELVARPPTGVRQWSGSPLGRYR